MHHISFTYNTLDDLFDTYERLKEESITPHLCINHGPTLSMYFLDPMQNSVELQIDTMSSEEAVAFAKSEVFKANPIGITFDPDDVNARRRAGEDHESLMAYQP